jgi:hypothetical protein
MARKVEVLDPVQQALTDQTRETKLLTLSKSVTSTAIPGMIFSSVTRMH